jgi:FkbM family methyltransferase
MKISYLLLITQFYCFFPVHGKNHHFDHDGKYFRYSSQCGQDEFLIEEITNYQKNGYFVEIGAFEGTYLSNTVVLERELDWQGICVEANPEFFKLMKERRNCIKVRACLDEKEQEVIFRVDNNVFAGIIDDDTDNGQKLSDMQIQSLLSQKKAIKMKTKTLEKVLAKKNAPKVIDFLSMDVEGAEYRILKNFPFDKYVFLAVVIERPTPELNELLFENDYVFVKNQECGACAQFDTWYIHKSHPRFDKIQKKPFEQVIGYTERRKKSEK